MSAKPFLYVFNVDEAALGDQSTAAELTDLVAPAGRSCSARRSRPSWRSSIRCDAAELLAGYGQDESGLVQLVRMGFAALGLQTFLTAGPKEARAWTIQSGATAPEAAGEIHTDFQRGFIKAEVVSYDDFVAAGSIAAVRAAGKARSRGQGVRDARRRRRRVPVQRLLTEIRPVQRRERVA